MSPLSEQPLLGLSLLEAQDLVTVLPAAEQSTPLMTECSINEQAVIWKKTIGGPTGLYTIN